MDHGSLLPYSWFMVARFQLDKFVVGRSVCCYGIDFFIDAEFDFEKSCKRPKLTHTAVASKAVRGAQMVDHLVDGCHRRP
jgi:hypothetical protein